MKNLSENTTKKSPISNNNKTGLHNIKSRFVSFLASVKIGSVFAGAVLGAGFAGGKELVIFFVRYGEKGVMASLIAGILFLIFGTTIIYKSKVTSSENYSSYLRQIFPEPIAICMEIISDLFLLVCFIIMLSGAGALFRECFRIPAYIGSVATAFIIYLVLKGGMKCIGTVCSILTPIMTLGIIAVDFLAICTEATPTFAFGTEENNTFILPAILYVSYNILSSAPVLCSASALAYNRKIAVYGGIAGGTILSAIAFISSLALYFTSTKILESDLPLLILSSKFSTAFHIFYAFVLYIAILTTAFSSGFPLVAKAERYTFSKNISSLLLCIIAIPLSFFNFSVLVEGCYTFFGILGLILIGAIVYSQIKNAIK